jgi:tRNA A37 threonylcarbamoyladenosine biosynthesis protein TsaE
MTTYRLKRTTHSREETKELGENLGTLIAAPALLALTGELGSGKTAFVQGLARGLEGDWHAGLRFRKIIISPAPALP